MEPKKTQTILTISATKAGSRFDGPAAVEPGADFDRFGARLFFEHGLAERWTLSGQAAFARSDLEAAEGVSAGGGGDFELGARRTLWKGRRTVGAFQASLGGTTGFAGARDPITGATGVDLEGRALVGVSLDDLLSGGFLDAQAAYRRRFGDAADEMRLDLTAGFSWGGTPWRTFIQSFNAIGVSEAVAPFERARIHKIATSVVGPLSRRAFGDAVQVQAGVERAVAGRSTFRETRVFTALWLTF